MNNLKLSIIFLINFFRMSYGTDPNFFELHNCPKEITNQLKLFSQIYEKNNINLKKPNNKPIIPLQIHQIWIGPKPLPKKFEWMINSWKKNHPTWEYKLWTNSDIKDFRLENQKAFDKAKNWGQKSDIWRYEILKRYGGVYLDIDFECLKNLDILHYNYDFYCCSVCETDMIANGVIASIPNHPILDSCIKTIGATKNFSSDFSKIMDTTGPFMFTKIVANYIKNNSVENISILPSYYFFPFPAVLRFDFWQNMIDRKSILKYTKPETFAIHYWATSWQERKRK